MLKKLYLFIMVALLLLSTNLFGGELEDLIDAIGFRLYSNPGTAPDFTLENLYTDQPTITLSELPHPVIFLNSWATWCGPCQSEGNDKQQLWEGLKDYPHAGANAFYFIAADNREDRPTVKSYIEGHNYTFPVYMDSDGAVATAYGVSGIPSHFMIVNGKLYGKHSGAGDWGYHIDKFKRIVDLVYTPQPTPTVTATPLPTITASPTPTPSIPAYNIALGKKVIASGEFSADFPKTALNDGNENTIWGSSYNAGNQWFFIDLEEEIEISNVVLSFVNPYYSPEYHVGVSNDMKEWTFAASITNGTGGTKTIPVNATARYIGVLLTKGAKKVYGVNEFEVYEKPQIPVTPTPTMTPTATPTPPITPPPFDNWASGVDYKVGNKVIYNGKLWECKLDHLSNDGWYPGASGVWFWEEVQ